jgi:DME family drug/metabolite transporter
MTMMSGVLWGTSFVTIQWGLEDGFHPVVFVAVRFVIAVASALAFAALMGPLGAWMLKSPWVWALGLSNMSGFVFQYTSLGLTTATKAALITNLSLVLVAPMSFLWLQERFTRVKVVALVAVVPGVFLLTTNGDPEALRGSEFVGDMLSLGAGLSWAFYIIISKRVLEDPQVTVSRLTLWVMTTTAVFLVPLGMAFLALGGVALGEVGGVGWSMAVYTGVFCSTLAYLLYTRGLRAVTATVSAVLLLIMVLVAAGMDYIFQGEGLGLVSMVGAAILLVSMMLMSLAGEGEGAPPEPPADAHAH